MIMKTPQLCSQWPCIRRATWFAEGGHGYCDICWRLLGRLQWYHELSTNETNEKEEGDQQTYAGATQPLST